MSDYAYVAEKAKKVFASVSRLESLMQAEPKNRTVQMNLAGMRKMAAEAQHELERLAALNQIEVCKYRIVPMEEQKYALGHISKSLLEYQNLFSQLHDSFKNGPKSKAIIGREAAEESELDFAYTYSGSLGIVLLTKNERDFFEGDLDASIEALYQIMDIDGLDDVRDIASARGRAVVKRIHDWSEAHVEGGFSADIQWKRSDGKFLGQVIDRSKLEKIVDHIVLAADERTELLEITGMLVAVSLTARSFQIAVPGGETYSGHFHDDFAPPSEMTVGRMYSAKIEVSDVYYYATDAHRISNSLLNLEGPIWFDAV